jgi:hypothetical protein
MTGRLLQQPSVVSRAYRPGVGLDVSTAMPATAAVALAANPSVKAG